jgi:hypothetical protein
MDVANAERYLTGTPEEAAAALVHDYATEARAGRMDPGSEFAPPGDVAQALERGSAQGLDRPGRAIFGTEAARAGQTESVGKLSEGLQRVGGLVDEGVARARERGQREGTQLGRGATEQRLADEQLVRARSGIERAQPAADELQQAQVQSTARIAGRVGRRYYEAGEQAAELRHAARTLRTEQRVLDKMDTRLRSRVEAAESALAAAPARYRPMLDVARHAKDSFEADARQFEDLGRDAAADELRGAAARINTTLAEAVDAGVDPHYFIGGKMPAEKARSPLYEGVMPGERGVRGGPTGERRARVQMSAEYTVRERQQLHLRRFARQVENETAMTLRDQFGRTPVQVLKDLPEEDVRLMSGQQLLDEMRSRGYEGWDLQSPFNPQTVPAGRVNLETSFLPKHIYNVVKASRPIEVNGLIRAFDTAQTAWKHSALALDPRWQIGNLGGNALMAMTEVHPLDYAGRFRDAVKIIKQGHVPDPAVLARLSERERAGLSEGAFMPAELAHRGQLAAESAKAHLPIEEKLPKRALIRRAYRFNGFIDDANRLAVYLDKLHKGMTDAEAAHFVEKYPEFKGLSRQELEREGALRLSLKTLGDFKKNGRYLRGWLRRIFPFSPWLIHITTLAARLPIEHPLRVAWTLHLADMYDGEEPPIEWLSGAVPLGKDRFLRLPNLNPFDQVGENVGLSQHGFDPSGISSNLSPLIGAVGALGFGYDVRGAKPMLRAPGTGRLDELGHEVPTPLLSRPAEAAYYLGSNIPPFAAAREAIPAAIGKARGTGGGPVLRYPTGQPYHVGGTSLPTDEIAGAPPGFGPLLGVLGIPRAEHIDVQALLDRAAGRRRQQASRLRSYRGQTSPRGGGGRSGTSIEDRLRNVQGR